MLKIPKLFALRRGYHTMRQRIDFWKRDIKIAKGSVIQPGAEIGDHTRINRPSFLTPCQIGRHCAIAGPLTVRGTNHNVYALALQAHTQKDLIGSKKPIHGYAHTGVKVGHNVWIGDSVILLDGTCIGHSSIVAAGSVVNKSFPPFSIIGGVPARLIRMRFTDEKIALLTKLEWWKWDGPKLRKSRSLFEMDLHTVSTAELKNAISKALS